MNAKTVLQTTFFKASFDLNCFPTCTYTVTSSPLLLKATVKVMLCPISRCVTLNNSRKLFLQDYMAYIVQPVYDNLTWTDGGSHLEQ